VNLAFSIDLSKNYVTTGVGRTGIEIGKARKIFPGIVKALLIMIPAVVGRIEGIVTLPESGPVEIP
jgi:hypothetical protein